MGDNAWCNNYDYDTTKLFILPCNFCPPATLQHICFFQSSIFFGFFSLSSLFSISFFPFCSSCNWISSFRTRSTKKLIRFFIGLLHDYKFKKGSTSVTWAWVFLTSKFDVQRQVAINIPGVGQQKTETLSWTWDRYGAIYVVVSSAFSTWIQGDGDGARKVMRTWNWWKCIAKMMNMHISWAANLSLFVHMKWSVGYVIGFIYVQKSGELRGASMFEPSSFGMQLYLQAWSS